MIRGSALCMKLPGLPEPFPVSHFAIWNSSKQKKSGPRLGAWISCLRRSLQIFSPTAVVGNLFCMLYRNRFTQKSFH
jgi:hypothetical protein